MIHQFVFDDGSVNDVLGGGVGTAFAMISGGQAIFGKTAQYLQLPSNLLGNFRNVTIEAWFYVSPATSCNNASPRLFSIGTGSSSYDIDIQFNSGGYLTFAQDISNSWDVTSSTYQYTSLGYFHVALVLTNNSCGLLYVNGVLNAMTAFAISLPTASQQTIAYISKSAADSNGGIVGTVDEFRVWSNALSPAQVKASYIAGKFCVSLN